MPATYTPHAPWIRNCHLQKLIQRKGFKNYEELLAWSQNNVEDFWNHILSDIDLKFSKPFDKILTSSLPWPKWAAGGKISIVENCIDRHARNTPEKIALLFEGDGLEQAHSWTFEELARESSFIAAELQRAGAKTGDRAALLMPMSLEMTAAFFGILRAGLTVIPIFSGFGAEAIESRLNDASVKFLFLQNQTYRRGKEVNVRAVVDEILPRVPSIQKVFSLKREDFLKGHLDQRILPSIPRASESECLLLYTSGTTGKPKACVHTPFGVLATTGKELRYAFDVQSNSRFFWYTDIGWMMGPWELFGVLQFGATVMLYEGVPDYPEPDRLWRIIDHYQITHLGISPTAVRVLKKAGDEWLQKYKLDSLRVLGSTGEPWDEESWTWFFEKVGKRNCPVINISGGTEVMGCLLMPNPLSELKPCTLGGPALGVRSEIWTEDGKKIERGLGHLVCLSPLPSMTKGFLNAPERYLHTYFEKFGEDVWYHGDWAFADDEGFWFLRGRSDDTIKIAGKRIGPNEFESALMADSRVAESAAVGIPHELKGECVYCYVVLKDSQSASEETRKALHSLMLKTVGKAMAPEKIFFVSALPKTRSGKILRGIIRKIVLGEGVDTSSAENESSIEAIRKAS